MYVYINFFFLITYYNQTGTVILTKFSVISHSAFLIPAVLEHSVWDIPKTWFIIMVASTLQHI